MASTSVRFIARSSKLVNKPSSLTQIHDNRYSHGLSSLSHPATSSIRTYLTSRHASLSNNDGKRRFPAFSRPCNLDSTQQRLDPSSRSGIPRSSQFQTLRAARYFHHFPPHRFASNQPPNTNEDVKESPPPIKIVAPEIVKQALATPHENIYTLPNFLTFTRLLSAPAIGYFVLTSQPLAALALFFYAGVTDLVDGYLARRFDSQTVVGTILDPMADKTLMTVCVVCLAVQAHIPAWLAVVILGRDVGLAVSACYYRYISLPPPKTFARYWDFSLPSAEVRPTEISKINTLLQLLLVGDAMVLPVLPTSVVETWNLVGVFEGWSYLVAATTVWSGLSYVFSNDAVKILGRDGSKP